MLSYDRLSRKSALFKSFTGLSVKQFDDIYKVIYQNILSKHEIKRLSHNKRSRDKELLEIVDVLSMFDLDFLRMEKNFPQQKSSLPIKKEKGCELVAEQKKSTTRTILQRG